MGHRLSKIYTRTGDDGTTGLGDGARVAKNTLRIEVIGTIDELNCLLGLLQSELTTGDPYQSILTAIQHDLFDPGGELSVPGYRIVTSQRVDWLEQNLDAINAELPPLKNFILPGGNKAGSWCHYARAVCRRTERHMVALMQAEDINDIGNRYLNRLSDLLFVMARALVRQHGGEEVLWQQSKGQPSDAATGD
jgi:cob(I)alamin adenosyltransferase